MPTLEQPSSAVLDTRGPRFGDPEKMWVVVGAGARDSYQAPLALHQAGLLRALITDFYTPLDRRFARAAFKIIPSRAADKLWRRFHPELPSRVVRSQFKYAIRNLLRPDRWPSQVHLLGQTAARIAAETDCGILAYSHVASAAFSAPGVPKVLFQMQPHPASVRDTLMEDTFCPRFPYAENSELNWDRETFARFSKEPLLADFCVVASTYTRHTLVANGVRPENIVVIPYGVDTDFFSPGEAAKPREFTVLFVGQLVRQKGLHYLLEAWQRLRLPNAELRIVAHGAVSSALGKDCAASSVSFVGSLCREDLRNEYRRADLLCLPSLSDGFGLVVLEAMACGTPALLTTGCGAADVVENGKNGFLVPSASLDDLMLRLEWAFENRSALREIGKAARATAQAFPWSRFRAELVATLRSLDS